jgi:hypothetical protein
MQLAARISGKNLGSVLALLFFGNKSVPCASNRRTPVSTEMAGAHWSLGHLPVLMTDESMSDCPPMVDTSCKGTEAPGFSDYARQGAAYAKVKDSNRQKLDHPRLKPELGSVGTRIQALRGHLPDTRMARSCADSHPRGGG